MKHSSPSIVYPMYNVLVRCGGEAYEVYLPVGLSWHSVPHVQCVVLSGVAVRDTDEAYLPGRLSWHCVPHVQCAVLSGVTVHDTDEVYLPG